MNIRVVTTFSNEGYSCYGERFVSSLINHSYNIPLVVYHESLPNIATVAENLTWKNLDHDSDRAKFMADHGHDEQKVSDPRFPNRQSIRFCHKVFALTREARECVKEMVDWLVWIDGDVVFHKAPDWKEVLPDHAWLSYLGRKGLYTECGFVGYRVSQPKVQLLLEDMRQYYTSGEIFTRDLDDRHDSRCFDICRERSEVPRDRWHSLSRHAHGTHVWPQTKLAEFCTHQKGPRRKWDTYGSVVR